MWTALGRELDGGEQTPAERSLASALPGCSTSRQCCCLHPLHSRAPFLAGDLMFFFVGRGGGGRWSTAQPLFGKKKREPLL